MQLEGQDPIAYWSLLAAWVFEAASVANGFVLKSTNQVKKGAKAVVKAKKSQKKNFIFVSSSKKGPKQLDVSTTCKKIPVIMLRWDENEKIF